MVHNRGHELKWSLIMLNYQVNRSESIDGYMVHNLGVSLTPVTSGMIRYNVDPKNHLEPLGPYYSPGGSSITRLN